MNFISMYTDEMKLKLLKGSNKLLSTSKVGTQEIKDGKSNLEIGSFNLYYNAES